MVALGFEGFVDGVAGVVEDDASVAAEEDHLPAALGHLVAGQFDVEEEEVAAFGGDEQAAEEALDGKSGFDVIGKAELFIDEAGGDEANGAFTQQSTNGLRDSASA